MPPSPAFRRVVALTAVVSGPLALGCLALGLAASGFDPAAFADPAAALYAGVEAIPFVRWSMLLDLLGYYLLLLPSAFYLRAWLRHRDPAAVDLYTFCGLGYLLVGAVGAAALGAVWPPLMRAYAAAGADREAVAHVFHAVTNLVHVGLWNTLEVLLAGVWWVGTGWLLRAERRALGGATVALGLAAALDGVGTALGLPALAAAGLTAYLVLAPAWAVWFGLAVAAAPVRRTDRRYGFTTTVPAIPADS